MEQGDAKAKVKAKVEVEAKAIVEAERVFLRPFESGDAPALHAILSDAETMAFVEPPYTREQTERFLADFCIAKRAALACVMRQTGELIGYMLFHQTEPGVYEMGWILNRRVWRRGLAYESCRALIAYAFEQRDARRVFAETADTVKSVGLMEKLEMRFEGVERTEGKMPLYVYGLGVEEYARRASKGL